MKTLDTRDLYKRKCELEELKEALENAREERNDIGDSPMSTQDEIDAANQAVQDGEADFGEDEQQELSEIEELERKVSDFMLGETMIPVDDFKEYAQQFADDIGAIDRNATWPLNCINWDQAADELAMDYSEVTYQGESYYVRF